MANRYAVASGNWSNTATWDGGTLPGVSDSVRPNGFNVTIDQNITVTELRNDASSPAVSGGTFIVSGAFTINARIYDNLATAHNFVTVSASVGNTITINGNIDIGAATNSTYAVVKTTNHNLIVNGNLSYEAIATSIDTACLKLDATSGGSTQVTGNVFGGTHGSKRGIRCASTEPVTIIGNLYGGATAVTTYNSAFYSNSACNLTVVGNLYASAGAAICLSGSTGTITITGNVFASISTPAIVCSLSEAAAAYQKIIVSGHIENYNEISAICAPKINIGNATTYWKFKKPDNSDRTLYSAETLPGVPSASNVRSGTAYGASGELTGTLAVPSPSNVRKGVSTDATIGTAEVTGEDIITALNSSSNPLAERLRNVATVQTTGDQIAALNTEE